VEGLAVVPALVPDDGIELPPPGDVCVRSGGGGGDEHQERGQGQRRRHAAAPRVHMIHTRSHPRGWATELSAPGSSAVGRGCWITSSFQSTSDLFARPPHPSVPRRARRRQAGTEGLWREWEGFGPAEYTGVRRGVTTSYDLCCY